MFFLRHIWNSLHKWPLIVAVLLSLSLTAAPALAAGETYTWKSTTDVSAITGTGGDYTAPATFTRQSTAGGGATYTGSASYTCPTDGSAHTDNLTLTFDAADYNNGQPLNTAEGSLTGGAACSDLSAVPTVGYANADPVTGASTGPAVSCDQGSFSWIFCPFIDNISKSVSSLAIQILTPLLQVNAITPSTTPQIYQVWTHIRDLADVLFILVFFAIIAATLFQQDIAGLNPYTIKSIWIRLIISAVMVQFSFLISGFLVDIGNVLGGGIQTLLTFLASPSAGGPSLSNVVGNLVGGSTLFLISGIAILTAWEIAIPVLFGLLIAILVGILTLGARFLIIAILIVVSPLACVAWVLPNTRHYMSDWAKLLFRLILMYPIIIGIFSLAGIVNEILPFSTTASSSGIGQAAAAIIKPLIAIAALLAVPEAFKLAGRGLERANSLLNGVQTRGQGFIKGSSMYQDGVAKRKERQASTMRMFAASPTMTELGKKGAIGKATRGGLLGAGSLVLAGAGAPTSQRAINKSFNKTRKEARKEIDDIDGINPSLMLDAVYAGLGDRNAIKKINNEKPELMRYANSMTGMSALVSGAAKKGVLNDEALRKIRSLSDGTRTQILMESAAGDDYAKKNHLYAIDNWDTLMPAQGRLNDNIASMSALDMKLNRDNNFYEAAIGVKSEVEHVGSLTGKTYKRVVYTPDARSTSIARSWSTANPIEVEKFLDPQNSRSYGTTIQRTLFFQMLANQKSEFMASDSGREILRLAENSILRHDNSDVLKTFAVNISGKDKDTVDALDVQIDSSTHRPRNQADFDSLAQQLIKDIHVP